MIVEGLDQLGELWAAIGDTRLVNTVEHAHTDPVGCDVKADVGESDRVAAEVPRRPDLQWSTAAREEGGPRVGEPPVLTRSR